MAEETPEVKAFRALSDAEKLAALFSAYDPSNGTLTLSPDFTYSDIRFGDVLTGDALENAFSAYADSKEELRARGGQYPTVRAMTKNGQLYAFSIELAVEGQFRETRIYDNRFEKFHEYKYRAS
jgi:hypothetical protein